MTVGQNLIQLQNGATIAVAEYGAPDGVPVIFCHGWPSSGTMAELTDSAARELGLRIISPDRPGISGSTFQPNRTLNDWPPVLAALANHFAIEKFHVLAISGGAPYAYSAAWAMPERVRAIAVVSGAPPIADLGDHSGLLRLYRWMLKLRGKNRELLRMLFYAARPFASRRIPIRLRPLVLKFLHPTDAAVLRESAAFESCFESARRAWRGSVDGVMTDAEVYAEPWGFRLEEIGVPVRLWHGKQDRAFSFRVIEEVAKRLPNCTARYVDNAGHYSLPIRYMHEILADLTTI